MVPVDMRMPLGPDGRGYRQRPEPEVVDVLAGDGRPCFPQTTSRSADAGG